MEEWIKRYDDNGVEGLLDHSRHPLNSCKKVIIHQEKLILKLRKERKLGVRRV